LPLAALTGLIRNDHSSTPLTKGSGGSPSPALPLVVHVVCGSAPSSAPIEVQPQGDGVHFAVRNLSGSAKIFTVAGVSGRTAPPGDSALVLPIAPGEYRVGCISVSKPSPPLTSLRAIHVVDAKGIWKASDIACQQYVGTMPDASVGVKGEPLQAATAYFKQLAMAGGYGPFPAATDIVERAGYPDATPLMFRAVRAGKVIGRIELSSDHAGGWLADIGSFCSR
jgi:hypothetical protein